MEILFWLVPAGVVTLVTMLWVGWWGREGRGEVDRETAARRLGEALGREQKRRPGYAVARRTPDRSTGVALRPSRMRPTVLPTLSEPAEPSTAPIEEEPPTGDRRAS
ncbi:hypothetical protein [Nocardioides bizhenqiangii]|uniref:Uncharacterized protein n=1 Tax=Nocardioides bizhenqiangii TaxID=3095076 RepID=A0ABZ0ZNQ3_9ACTN|nr:hypothetical protein [Nocardioides sp. HM61]WQQ25409.1 hypothetical protein SHK19_15745 [Nocardioides sp. HM61]